MEATEAAEEGVTALLRIEGAGAGTPEPFGMVLPAPGESSTGEVSVAVTGAPGVSLPVTVIAETGTGRITHEASVTVAEAGWTMWMVSHFHYDPVWWNTQGQFTEARLVLPDEDGSLPDTRTAFDLVRLHLEKARRDPDYKFVLAELDYLKPHFDAFPAERAFLRSLLRDGRAELVGGTYNEPNTNLTGAETTIRNAVYGMGFQRGILGAEPASAWMLDAFGFDPGFPGLMAQAGLASSSWARGPFHQWGPAVNTEMQFPAEFEWLSPDGSGLLTAYMANHYSAGWTLHTSTDLAAALAAAYDQFRQLAPVAATRNVMLPVGTDHVIPARWVTDVAREWSARYVWPRFVPAIPREFFAAVRADSERDPARYWIMPQTRDMNPVYTGKDVSYADTKLAARVGEVAVLEGERFATLAWLRGAPYPAESLDKAWRQLAYGAHHDAITGTESDEVYLDLLAGWREAWERGDTARREAVEFLTSAAGAGGADGLAVTVVNGLARERDGMATVTVTLAAAGTPWLAVLDPVTGEPVPALAEGVTRHPDGSLAAVTLTFRARGVPPLGCTRYPLVPAAGPDGWADIDGLTISNDAFTVTGSAAHGALASIVERGAGRELLLRPGNDLVLQEEYQQHPRWNEGPWHLSPKGPGLASSSVPASVMAQRSPVGSRLIATYPLGDLSVTTETLLWDGADRVEFRTHVSGSIGKEHLLRVRFPASLPGGLPVYQTATAVIGRPFGAPEADVADHWWTLDNPANHWFGIGSVARVSLGTGIGHVALGVGEVVTPDVVPEPLQPVVKDLLTGMARAGVTATCTRAAGTRYGSLDLDSNLPDFRIALGGPSSNAFTAEVLAGSDPSVAKRLAQLVAEAGAARLWVPAAKSRAAAFAPGADVRGPRDLPVLIVATADPAKLDQAITELARNFTSRWITADTSDGNALAPGDAPLSLDGDIALFNRGTPSGVVTPDGTLWMSLMRACSGWPSGVWIDGDRRTVPDGSSFAWQHWSHTFTYALTAAGSGDWCGGGFNDAAEDYNHDFLSIAGRGPGAAGSPGLQILEVPDDVLGKGGVSLVGGTAIVTDEAPDVVHPLGEMGYVALSALKPRGNPLAAGLPGTSQPSSGREVTVRLRETDGLGGIAGLRIAGGIEAAWRSDLLEESDGEPLTVHEGTALVPVGPFETVTVAVRLASVTEAAQGGAAEAAAALPEPAQPVFTRYWLHGKGPAPAGNVPVAVHFSPTRVTLGTDAMEENVTLTVASGPAGGRGTVELVVPEGLDSKVAGFAGSPAVLSYDLEPNGYAAWDVAVRAHAGTADGRYFVTARITDDLGQVLEDVVLVTIGEAGGPDPDLEPEELFFRLQSDVMALADEVHLEVLPASLQLAPGAAGTLEVRIASRLASQLRGEAQLVSPVGTWQGTGPWTQPVTVSPGGEATVRFDVTVPATATPGWESWLLVKLMYFGRVRYSEAVRLTVS
ncbi:MAG TPA: glycoside hydrolase family 38 C-terminal domain-containing protein [Amycolatopsis sp.]|nr:glycoside hydrolase family 38 C-terminal domain-containing protein [Amycolatopsis sp.]